MKNINWLTLTILIIYPLFILGSAFTYWFYYGISKFEIALLIFSYYVTNISVGIGFHRLWSHNSYKASPIVEFILMFLTAGTLQGPVLAWASDHCKHHIYTDKEQDPHSPFKYKNKLLGFLWSHMGWMLTGEGSYKSITRSIMKTLGKKKILVWQLKYYWQVATFMNLILPLFVGWCLSSTLKGAIAAYIFIGVGRALQQQMTFCVNSLCHMIGTRKYYSGTARDIWWLFFALLGENWHNFHHAFAQDYRNGVKWYHLDIHKWIIWSMEKLGLATNLIRTSEDRIRIKMAQTKAMLSNEIVSHFMVIENTARAISKLAANTKLKIEFNVSKAEKSAYDLKVRAIKHLDNLEQSANLLAIYVQELLDKRVEISERLLIKAQEHFKKLEQSAYKLGIYNYSMNLRVSE